MESPPRRQRKSPSKQIEIKQSIQSLEVAFGSSLLLATSQSILGTWDAVASRLLGPEVKQSAVAQALLPVRLRTLRETSTRPRLAVPQPGQITITQQSQKNNEAQPMEEETNRRSFSKLCQLAVCPTEVSARLAPSTLGSFAFLFFVLGNLFIAVRIGIPRSKH